MNPGDIVTPWDVDVTLSPDDEEAEYYVWQRGEIGLIVKVGEQWHATCGFIKVLTLHGTGWCTDDDVRLLTSQIQ